MTETDTEYILNTLLDNDTIEGEKLLIGNYISSIVCDVQKGDEIIINSLTTLEEENIKIAGIILGMLTDLFALKWAFVTLADMMGVLLPALLSVKTVVLNVAIVSACYFGTLAVIKRKTNNVDMVECLKDNRE